jgi:hypothetical protein
LSIHRIGERPEPVKESEDIDQGQHLFSPSI